MTYADRHTAGGRCRLCGVQHVACGPPSTSVPVDHNFEEAAVGGPLRRYRVVMHGTETVMKLTGADAERLGAEPLDEAPPPPANPTAAAAEPQSKARAGAANKARTGARTKGGGGGGD